MDGVAPANWDSSISMKSLHKTRAEEKFRASILRLQQSLPKTHCRRLEGLEFPEFGKNDTVEQVSVQLEKTLQSLIVTRSQTSNNELNNKTKKLGIVVSRLFQASYPFANLFLSVARAGSSVIYIDPLIAVADPG